MTDPDIQAIRDAADRLEARLTPQPVVFDQINQRTDWILDPKSQGANVPLGDFRFVPGNPGLFNAVAPGGPYAGAYWYNVLDNTGLFSNFTKFRYEMALQAGFADWAKCQAVEFELQLCVAGLVFNMAWQADMISKLWRVFNYAAHAAGQPNAWEPTTIPVDTVPMSGAFFPIVADFMVNSDKTVTHTGLTLNGVAHPLSLTHPSVQHDPVTANYLHAAFQLDANSVPDAYSVQVRNMRVEVQ